jgi:uncharacterized protein YgiB involved in biofilm formation
MSNKTRVSKNVVTRLVGAAGLSATFVLAGCRENEIPTHAYTNVDQCITGGKYNRGLCQGAYNGAHNTHSKLAPRYLKRKDCEKDFGQDNCYPMLNHYGSYTPRMGGFLIGKEDKKFLTAPLYSTAKGKTVTLSGRDVSPAAFSTTGALTKSGSFSLPSSSSYFLPGRSITSRGGFGRFGRGTS